MQAQAGAEACPAKAAPAGVRDSPALTKEEEALFALLAEVGPHDREGAPPPPPSRTKWTRLVPQPILTGHAASLLGREARSIGLGGWLDRTGGHAR
jgi:hypothetical protein